MKPKLEQLKAVVLGGAVADALGVPVEFANQLDEDDTCKLVYDSSALTHAHECSKIGCNIYTYILKSILNCPHKVSVKVGLLGAGSYYNTPNQNYDKYSRLFGVENLQENDIKSGGYVVHTLEAAVWCLFTTNSYEECVLKAVNLGDDTDTVAAVAGTLAAAISEFEYGNGIEIFADDNYYPNKVVLYTT